MPWGFSIKIDKMQKIRFFDFIIIHKLRDIYIEYYVTL